MTSPVAGRSVLPAMAGSVVVGAILTAAFALLGAPVLAGQGWQSAIGLAIGAAALAAAVLAPVHWLPAMALIAFTVIPTRITPADLTQRVPLWGLLIVLWVVRRLLTRRRAGSASPAASGSLVLGWRILMYISAGAFLLWAAFLSVRSVQTNTSVGWLASVVVCVFLPLLVLEAKREAELLRSAWIVGGGVTGGYAVIELLLQANPVYDAIYAAVGTGSVQHWVLHRAESAFGHPLLAGTYFAAAAVLGIVAWLDNRRGRDLTLGLLAAAGAVATVSRSSMLALAVALAVGLVAWVLAHPNRSVGKPVAFGLLGVIAAIGVLNSTPLEARSGSIESVRSAGARDTAFEVAILGARSTNWLGSGPGTSGITGRLFDDVVIESSALQLLLSVGMPGLVFFTLFVLAIGLTAVRGRDIAAAAALLAFVICILGYNAMDAVRPTHLLLGFLVIICLNPVTPPRTPSSTAPKGQARNRSLVRSTSAPESGR